MVQLPPTSRAMLHAVVIANPALDPGFLDGVVAERTRVAADMRRRASEIRISVGELRVRLDEPIDLRQHVPAEVLGGAHGDALRAHETKVRSIYFDTYASSMLQQAETFDTYAEDLERAPS